LLYKQVTVIHFRTTFKKPLITSQKPRKYPHGN